MRLTTLPAPIIGVLVGALLLLFGRRLFWLCVAAVGFAAGIELAPQLVHEPSPILALSFSLVLGFVGALLAFFLQKIAVAIVGFVAGGKLAIAIAAAFVTQEVWSQSLLFLIGGFVGALLFIFLFDWALIVISSLLGAYLIQSAFVLPHTGATIIFLALAIVGVVLQMGLSRRRSRVA
jgi:Domain of unknown function (DUF4203)